MLRLRKGDIILLQGKLWRVTMVNASRAVIEPLERVRKKITRPNGEDVEFEARQNVVSISAASDVPIVGRDIE